MNVTEALLDSWDRQARIVAVVADRIDESNKRFLPSSDSTPIFEHLAHMHHVRRFFLRQFDQELAASMPRTFEAGGQDAIEDLDAIRAALAISAVAVRKAVADALADGREKCGWYDNAVLFLQHMVWHEGWHVGMIFLALRLNGQEPPQEWEESKVWGEWRTETW